MKLFSIFFVVLGLGINSIAEPFENRSDLLEFLGDSNLAQYLYQNDKSFGECTHYNKVVCTSEEAILNGELSLVDQVKYLEANETSLNFQHNIYHRALWEVAANVLPDRFDEKVRQLSPEEYGAHLMALSLPLRFITQSTAKYQWERENNRILYGKYILDLDSIISDFMGDYMWGEFRSLECTFRRVSFEGANDSAFYKNINNVCEFMTKLFWLKNEALNHLN